MTGTTLLAAASATESAIADSTQRDGSATRSSAASVSVIECATVNAVTILATSQNAPRKLSAGCLGRAVLHQRDRYRLAADGQLIVVERVLKLELEGDVLDGAAVVDDVDFVEGVRIQMEVVRAAVRVLQRQVVGDERHVTAASRS
jgi:hypothetical protein